jgi:RimJ/RimL family protein N-acetyltransferase
MIQVANLKDVAPDILTPLIEKYRYTPYWYIPGVEEEGRRTLLRRQLESAWNKETVYVLGAMINSSLVGFLHMNKLYWDSDHFGFDIVRLNHILAAPIAENPAEILEALLDAALAECAKNNTTAIHTRIPLDEIRLIQLLERFGFRMMDVQVTYCFDLQKQDIVDFKDKCVIRGYQNSDKETFVDLARTAYTLDRFHADPHLSKERSDELHAQWIKNSCEGQIADYVVVAEVDGQPVGYTTCVFHGDHGDLLNLRIGGMILSAVAPQARGRGCYTSMINGGLKWFKDKADVVYLGTQVNNYPVQQAWAKLGFRLAQASVSLHLWLKD